MKWLRAVAPVAFAVAFAWLVSGQSASCGKTPILQLIQVLDVAPRDVELSDRIAIVGSGFPAGKRARVTFRGALRRPGESAQEGVELAVWGTAIGPEQVEVGFDEATQALFCGAGDRATHTTFEGEVEVAFAAAIAGAPPIAGVLEGLTLDVLPSPTAASVDRDREGERVLAYLGLHPAPSGAVATGLRVEAVDPASRGQAAQIAPGDVLTTFDGVRITSFGDLVARPGEREADVGVRVAGGTVETSRRVAIDGLRRAPPTELLGSALLVVAALALVLLFHAPTPRAVATAFSHAAFRLRARVGATPGGRPSWRAVVSNVVSFAIREALPPAGGPLLVDATACAALAVMPFGQYVVAAKLDVGVLFLAAVAALAGAALATERSLWRGLSGALQTAWQHLPAAAAVASVVLTTGSLRVQEIERAQGGFPWDWLAFRSPAALAALVLLLSATRIEVGPPARRGELASLVDEVAWPPAALEGHPYLSALCRAHRVILAGLATVLFLGGWALPFVTPSQQDAHPALELLGGVWLLAKAGALVLFLAWTRSALPVLTLPQRTRLTAFGLFPAAMVALGATFGWVSWGLPRSGQALVSMALVAIVVLGLAAAAHRLRHGLAAPGNDGRLSPFL